MSGEHREEVSRHSIDCKGSEKTNFFFVDNISKRVCVVAQYSNGQIMPPQTIAQWHRLQRPHSVKIRASGPISAGPSLGPQQNHNKISANKSYDPIALLI